MKVALILIVKQSEPLNTVIVYKNNKSGEAKRAAKYSNFIKKNNESGEAKLHDANINWIF